MDIKKIRRLLLYYFENLPILFFVREWWLVVLGYLGVVNLSDGVLLHLRNGLRFFVVHHLDALVLREIIWSNEYQFVQKNRPMTIVDVGANIGTFSIFAGSARSDNKVYAFEPSPTTCKQMMVNLNINGLENVYLDERAVFSRKGSIKLYENGMSGQRSVYKYYGKRKYVEVETVTLETAMKKWKIKRIDFLKMDCEGAEYEILRGLKKATFAVIEKISLEYHELERDQRSEELIRLLEKRGFNVRHRRHTIETNIGYIWADRT